MSNYTIQPCPDCGTVLLDKGFVHFDHRARARVELILQALLTPLTDFFVVAFDLGTERTMGDNGFGTTLGTCTAIALVGALSDTELADYLPAEPAFPTASVVLALNQQACAA